MSDEDLIQQPYVLMAAPSRYINESGGTATFKNCYHHLTLPPPSEGQEADDITVNIVLCSGAATGTYQSQLDYYAPGGHSVRVQPGSVTFDQPYQLQPLHLHLLVARIAGHHFYDLRLNGRLVMRVPLLVELQEKLPPLGKMVTYPERVSRH